jgi:hypothetical protein
MEYTLKHKNIDVASLLIEEDEITEILSIHSSEHLPIGLRYSNTGKPHIGSLDSWWSERSIPNTRQKLDVALSELDVKDPAELLTKNFSLSLSDQYWMCPKDKKTDWHDVNFFENEFSPDIGDALFGKKSDKIKNFVSPDATTDGWLKKRWAIMDGKRVLIKGGSNPYYQEPYNEVLASEIMKRLGVPHIEYRLAELDNKPYSLCENFIAPDTELIPAWRIINSEKQPNHLSNYQHFLAVSDKIGVSDAQKNIDDMIVVDFIISNTDRHYNNFGMIRNADTLEWIGNAPVYDSGTSMFHNLSAKEIKLGHYPKSKPFKQTHREQIELVRDISFYDFNKLNEIGNFYDAILKQSNFIENDRREILCEKLDERLGLIKKIAIEKPHYSKRRSRNANRDEGHDYGR